MATSTTSDDKNNTTVTAESTVVPTIPVDLLIATATSYASAHGIQVEKKHSHDATQSYFECAPISLLPNAYPRAAFETAQSAATAFNLLVDRIARNADFLKSALVDSGVIHADPYTAKLWQLYQEIYNNDKDTNHNKYRFAKKAAANLGIFRSDYMLHKTENNLPKQVELNTIASSFAGLSTRVAALHQFLTARYQSEIQEFLQYNQRAVMGDAIAAEPGTAGVPENKALENLAAALNVAVQYYRQSFVSTEPPSSTTKIGILFVVQPGESNTVDQRSLEFQLWKDYQIPVTRMSLADLHQHAVVDADTGVLTVHGMEMAVVYYRAGYAPTDYPGGDNGVEWQARFTLETSRATKCPNLGYHLAGTKKVQQELARPGVLEQFFNPSTEADKIQAMRAVFAGLYSLGEDVTAADLEAVRDVLTSPTGPERYVLKPQREGGGYNFYGENLLKKLQELVTLDPETGSITLDKKLGEYILMERLFPPQQEALLLRLGKLQGSGPTISELGCFGTIVTTATGDVLHNEYAGFLLRTKFANVDEGGVASGFATLSSPYLC